MPGACCAAEAANEATGIMCHALSASKIMPEMGAASTVDNNIGRSMDDRRETAGLDSEKRFIGQPYGSRNANHGTRNGLSFSSVPGHLCSLRYSGVPKFALRISFGFGL